jgi:carboxypeptidase C (cathepsin A)
VPTGKENPFSWSHYAHLVFVDQPVGVGFSYNRGKIVDNTKTVVNHFINFMLNFMANNSYGLETNPFILAGEGYAGHYIPAIFQAVNTNT